MPVQISINTHPFMSKKVVACRTLQNSCLFRGGISYAPYCGVDGTKDRFLFGHKRFLPRIALHSVALFRN